MISIALQLYAGFNIVSGELRIEIMENTPFVGSCNGKFPGRFVREVSARSDREQDSRSASCGDDTMKWTNHIRSGELKTIPFWCVTQGQLSTGLGAAKTLPRTLLIGHDELQVGAAKSLPRNHHVMTTFSLYPRIYASTASSCGDIIGMIIKYEEWNCSERSSCHGVFRRRRPSCPISCFPHRLCVLTAKTENKDTLRP